MRGRFRLAVTVGAALGALVLMVSVASRSEEKPSRSGEKPSRSGGEPSRSGGERRYQRGVNVFTLAYAAGVSSYPTELASSYEYLASRGLDLVRLPFYWGKLQPRLGGPFEGRYWRSLKREVRQATSAGLDVILDLHNSCRHPEFDSPSACGNGISQEQLNDVWVKLSDEFADDRGVIAYDLMNEPYEIDPKVWERSSQGVVNALRAKDDDKLVWVEASGFSSPADFERDHPRAWIDDPADNVMYSAHQYFDGGGQYVNGPEFSAYETGGTLARLKLFTDWLERNDARGSVGEVGWPSRDRTESWKQWNDLGEKWYRAADEAGLWVTYFSATSAYREKQVAYDAPQNKLVPVPGISKAETQAEVIERHLSR